MKMISAILGRWPNVSSGWARGQHSFGRPALVGAILAGLISSVAGETIHVGGGGTAADFIFISPPRVDTAVYSEIAWQGKTKAGFDAFDGSGRVFLTENFAGSVLSIDGSGRGQFAAYKISYDRYGALIYSTPPTRDTYLVYYPSQPRNASVARTATTSIGTYDLFYPGDTTSSLKLSLSYILSDEFFTAWLIQDVESAPFNFTGVLTNTPNSAFRLLAFNEADYDVAKLHYQLRVFPGRTGKITWFEVFTPEDDPRTPADESKNLEYVFMSWDIPTGATQTPVYAIDPLGVDPLDLNRAKRHPTINGNYGVVPVKVEIAVDANRDGQIQLSSEAASDATSAEKPFRFWLNDDDDNADSVADANDAVVNGAGDLKDFFPVFLNLKQLVMALPPSASVKYKLKQEEGALNFVYTNLTRATAFSYVGGTLTTGFGPNFVQPAASAATQSITSSGVDIFSGSAAFLDALQNRDGGVLLIEGRQRSNKPLVLSVEQDNLEIARIELPLAVAPTALSADNDDDGQIGPKDKLVQLSHPLILQQHINKASVQRSMIIRRTDSGGLPVTLLKSGTAKLRIIDKQDGRLLASEDTSETTNLASVVSAGDYEVLLEGESNGDAVILLKVGDDATVSYPMPIRVINADIIFRCGSQNLADLIGLNVTHGGFDAGAETIFDIGGAGPETITIAQFYAAAVTPMKRRVSFRAANYMAERIMNHIYDNMNAHKYDNPSGAKPWNLFTTSDNYITSNCLEWLSRQWLRAIREVHAELTDAQQLAMFEATYYEGTNLKPIVIPDLVKTITGQVGVPEAYVAGLVAAANLLGKGEIDDNVFHNQFEGTFYYYYPGYYGVSFDQVPLLVRATFDLYSEGQLNTITPRGYLTSSLFIEVPY